MQSLDQPEDQGDHVKRVGVIGGGTMRTGIAKVVARASDSASFLEHDTTSANATADRIQSSLARAGKLGRRDSNVSSDIFARINVTLGTQTPPETPGG
ncbi:3-hydroxyacyl-CoA dehydrogenase NAD-binding domain-containing protein [Rhodococcus opacus]|uniref:3-hydroxyacyl-CoA dehydrogenase NAD-binding domain-containing protein n=1 Tax=Rhodococcus opacus TaxID=37919 RepID=UPI0037CBB2F7